MLRVILAALLGYAFIGLLIFGTDLVYGQLIPGMHPNAYPPIYYQLAMLTDTLYTFAGGWLCGRISRYDSRATWGLIILGQVMGVAATVILWNTAPHYYSFYLLVMYPFAVWFAAKQPKRASA